jgi:hypothetical protein
MRGAYSDTSAAVSRVTVKKHRYTNGRKHKGKKK